MSLLSKPQDSCLSLALLMVGELVQPCLTLFGVSELGVGVCCLVETVTPMLCFAWV